MKNVVVALLSRKRSNGLTEYLLVKSRKDFGRFTDLWYPPGGHLEENEDEIEALVREVQEELGLKIKPTKKIATTPGDIENQITHWWKCDISSNGMKVDQEEIAEVGWFIKDEMEKNMPLWPATRNFFEKYVFSREN